MQKRGLFPVLIPLSDSFVEFPPSLARLMQAAHNVLVSFIERGGKCDCCVWLGIVLSFAVCTATKKISKREHVFVCFLAYSNCMHSQ
jgi:hypothetical protein